jgi:hypothetical protein
VLLVSSPSRAYKAFHDAAKVTGAVDKDGIGSAKAHYQLAKFCDDQLKHLEAKEQSEGALDVRSCRQPPCQFYGNTVWMLISSR